MLSEEDISVMIFAAITLAPIAATSSIVENSNKFIKYPALTTTAIATVPWFILTSAPAFIISSCSYKGILWPIRWYQQCKSIKN